MLEKTNLPLINEQLLYSVSCFFKWVITCFSHLYFWSFKKYYLTTNKRRLFGARSQTNNLECLPLTTRPELQLLLFCI